MSAREIPSTEWLPFLERFSREHRAWLATVERIDPMGSRHVEVIERPLDAVTPDLEAQQVIRIAIQFQPDSHAESVHVGQPVRLRIDETPEGAAQALEIENRSGERTRLRFRATALPEMLDGVAPGEL